ncbi:MAG: hypothetical protein F2801_07800 [Actinobacteria bacterium]|nr:hypothetical protein [Actinomycetota bacterium]
MSNVTNYLSPEEINAYQTRSNQYDLNAQRGLAQNLYTRTQGDIDYGRGTTKLNQSWDQGFKGLPSSYGHRGVLRSGIYQDALQNHLYDRQQAFDDYSLQNQRRLDTLSQQDQNLESQRNVGQQQIESERSARQAGLAARLRQVQGVTG